MAEIKDGKLYVRTPFGTLVAYPGGEPDYPGIYIDLHKEGCLVDAPLILTEYTGSEGGLEAGGHIITRIWETVSEEEYTERTVHADIDSFFAESGNKCHMQGDNKNR